MPNPNPVQTEGFKAARFKAVSELPSEPLAKQPARVVLGKSVQEYLNAMAQGDRINLMRKAITKAVEEHRDDRGLR
jgi:hypothetical protein